MNNVGLGHLLDVHYDVSKNQVRTLQVEVGM